MTAKERIQRILKRQKVDRIGLYEQFWSDTQRIWAEEGHITSGESISNHFGYDIETNEPFNFIADLDFVPLVLEETEETILARDGNGALLRKHKLHESTPEHVDFLVKERRDWEEYIKPMLKSEPRRIDFEAFRTAKRYAAKNDQFFAWVGLNVFEFMHPVCGHENMLAGMALDPDWIKDMVETYSNLTVELMEILFDKEGLPDGIWFFEDLGFKHKPFISPAMYRELLQPAHIKTFGFAHSKNLPVIVHSCGFIEPLVPGLMEAGMDCLQAIEIKAGMDLLKLHKDYGDRLSLMGGIDVRTLYSNDRREIDRELESKIPIAKEGFGYILHSDHSIPGNVKYETYRYFIERGLELGRYDLV